MQQQAFPLSSLTQIVPAPRSRRLCVTRSPASSSLHQLVRCWLRPRCETQREHSHFVRTKTPSPCLPQSAHTGADQLLAIPTRNTGFLSSTLAAAAVPSCPGDHGRVPMRHGANREHQPRLWLPPHPSSGLSLAATTCLPERRSRFTTTVKTAVLHRQTAARGTACTLYQLHISPVSARLETPLSQYYQDFASLFNSHYECIRRANHICR